MVWFVSLGAAGWMDGWNSYAPCAGSGGAAPSKSMLLILKSRYDFMKDAQLTRHRIASSSPHPTPPLHTSHPSLVSEINVRISSDFSRDSSQCWSGFGLAMESDQASIQSNPFSQELAKQNQLNIHRIRISFQNINIPSASGPQRCDSSDVSVPLIWNELNSVSFLQNRLSLALVHTNSSKLRCNILCVWIVFLSCTEFFPPKVSEAAAAADLFLPRPSPSLPPSLIIFQMDSMSDLKRRAVRDIIPVTLLSNLSAACPQWLISVTPQSPVDHLTDRPLQTPPVGCS
jgi:hypothetical protein